MTDGSVKTAEGPMNEETRQAIYEEYRIRVKTTPPREGEGFLPSLIPVETYPAESEEAQEKALAESPQLRKMAALRAKAKDDPYNPSFHFYHPDSKLNDPNGLCFWRGKWHLFYQLFPSEDPRPHWGHTVSGDLVHWKDLPIALYPDDSEYAVYSGASLAEEDRVIVMYHGRWSGNKIAVSSDPLLLNWRRSPANPVIPLLPDHARNGGRPYAVFDPYLWKEGADYYALSGVLYGNHEERGRNRRNQMVEHLFHSQDLDHWVYMGELAPGGFPQMPLGNDGACPYFCPIGDRHVLFFFSHESGPHAIVGSYDPITHRFAPDRVHKFNFGPLGCSSYQAPCAVPDGKGGVWLVLNTKDADLRLERKGAMSAVYHVTLGEDGDLRFAPAESLASLHGGLFEAEEVPLKALEPVALGEGGKALDVEIELARGSAGAFRIEILRSPDGREHTDITVHLPCARRPRIAYLTVDTAHSSLGEGIQSRIPESTPFLLDEEEPVRLRILVDKCMTEVFAGGRAVLMQMVYPTLPESAGVSVTAVGGEGTVSKVRIWQMKSIYE